ncbi:MAG: error-prone DNA polymerase, partial [Deltaproteobacteria bacterium]|nr:error-prone DNA polymerase [Deltaproteobacteria bacterium]
GYANLCRLITIGRRRCDKGSSQVSWDEVCAHAAGLIALWGGAESLLVVDDELARQPAPGRCTDAIIGAVHDAFGDRLYALVARHRQADEVPAEARLRQRARRHGLPLVAATEVLYHTPARRPLQDVLTCTRHGVTLASAGRLTRPNAEHGLLAPAAMAALLQDDPAAVARSAEVASRCDFSLAGLRYRYPSERLPDGTTSSQWLRQLTLAGAARRYGGEVPADVTAQLEHELRLVDELDYCGYFLTMHEIVERCRQQGILCQGRGSAANSAVCYCLGITAVDPVRMGLLFERFVSRERAEPPDIDLDIMHERREEVIQWVFEKYGREHAAMVAVVIRYRARSAIREVGKVFGLPPTAVDRLARLHGHCDLVDEKALQQAGLELAEPTRGLFLACVHDLLDFPRHLSIHPGGFLLGHEPVHDLVPIENGAMAARTVIQWDKDDVEALGLFKVDLLGLGALTQLDLAFELLRRHRGVELSMATIPADDAETFEMIQRADTLGAFQIESRAQMNMLPRLRPSCYYDLVIEISLVRPGPISGGMVHPYLRRRAGEEPVAYPHPSLEPVLAKTLGVPIFQEQVMKLAVVAADYTPGEADQLRRDMAAWRKAGRIERHRGRLIARMVAKGIAQEFAEQVFDQIRGFGEYGFPESHAASFALISYATAYLKCHFPAEFFCALLDAQPMGFYSIATLVEGARRCGVEVRPIDVLHSAWDCTLEEFEPTAVDSAGVHRRLALRMGLRYVKGLSEGDGQKIAAWQASAAPRTLESFVRETGLDQGALCALAEAGAFEGFGLDRRQALWEVRKLCRERRSTLAVTTQDELPAFAPLDASTTIGWDYQASSHSARGHPLKPLREELRRQGLPDAATVASLRDGQRVHYAGLVICRQRPGTASGVTFMTLEDETGFVNVVVWAKVHDVYRVLLRGEPFLGVSGRLQAEQGVVHLIADRLWVPRVGRRPVAAPSHDFH